MIYSDDQDLALLLNLDGMSYEMAAGYVVEFKARSTSPTLDRPHGVNYALVLRPMKGGLPLVRFDNAHRVAGKGRQQRQQAFDHWHRTEHDKGQPYPFTTAAQLLEDFWREVKRALDERGIPNDL